MRYKLDNFSSKKFALNKLHDLFQIQDLFWLEYKIKHFTLGFFNNLCRVAQFNQYQKYHIWLNVAEKNRSKHGF